MREHPLLGDYHYNKFGAQGFALCHSGTLPAVVDGRIAINAPSRHTRRFVIDDAPPEGHSRRRFSFDGITLEQIERILPWREGETSSSFAIKGSHIGSVEHVLGRAAEDYRDDGSTSQDFADCNLTITANPSGILFEFAGTLSTQGLLRPVVPSLYQAAYDVRCRMTWPVARYFFHPNSLTLLYKEHGPDEGLNHNEAGVKEARA